MKSWRTVFFLIIFYPLATYAGESSPVVELVTNLFDPPLPLPHYIDFAEQRMKKRFGNALSNVTKEKKGYEPGETLYLTTWQYPGFTITTAKTSLHMDNSWFTEIEVTGQDVKLQHNVAVGMTKGKIQKLLGSPGYTRDSLLIYGVDSESIVGAGFRVAFNAAVTFLLDESNRVSVITWEVAEPD